MRRSARFGMSLAVPLIGLAVVGCGGGAKSTATTTHRGATPHTGTAPHTATPGAHGPTVTSGPVRAVLRAQSHAPVIGRNWVYTITVTDANGRPLDGYVVSQFAFAGQVVGRETPPTHRLKHGRLRDVIQFPARTLGIPVTFEPVIHTHLGSVTLSWPVKARR